jgi:hypothetical protein
MGRILSFVPRQAAFGRPSTSIGQNGRELAAAVIIFPGVRYERPGEGGVRSQTGIAGNPQPPLGKPTPRH